MQHRAGVDRGRFELPEDMRVQERTWTVQRIGWVVMAAFVVASLLGIFAVGPLSSTTAHDGWGLLQVDYQRFERQGAATRLSVRASPDAVAAGRLTLVIGPAFLRAYSIQTMTPQPTSAASEDGRLVLAFSVPTAPAQIWMTILPEKPGIVESHISLVGRSPVWLWQLIYP